MLKPLHGQACDNYLNRTVNYPGAAKPTLQNPPSATANIMTASREEIRNCWSGRRNMQKSIWHK